MKKLLIALSLIALTTAGFAFGKKAAQNPIVVLETTAGDISIELFKETAPETVKNFLTYVKDGYYTDTIFHRVIPGFMIQGGGYKKDLSLKPTRGSIKNEATNGLSNKRGTIAMARTAVIDSATSQFFINVVNNNGLDHKNTTRQGYGYCVFGKIIEGLDICDNIVNTPTTRRSYHQNVPIRPIIIKSARLVN